MNEFDKKILAEVKEHGSVRAAARANGTPKSTYIDWHKKAREAAFTSREIVNPVKVKRPRAGQVKTFILTSAQDDTDVFEPFLDNLLKYAEYRSAELYIGGFTYNKSLFEEHSKNKAEFHPSLEPYMTNKRMELGPNLAFCGEMNTLPTAVDPLSGLESYTQHRSSIFPHVKVALKSVATMKYDDPKQIMTTGTVTKPNYVPKKAGLKAEFHHVYAAVIVELMPDGSFFTRHLHGEDISGNFYDLDVYVRDQHIIEGTSVEAITFGDIHHEKLEQDMISLMWDSEDSLVETLKPKYQVLHDLLDFKARNPHAIHDPHFMFHAHQQGYSNVKKAIEECSEFLQNISQLSEKVIVVESNHDNMLTRWLKTADYRNDPENAIYFLELQLDYYIELEKNTPEREICILENQFRKLGCGQRDDFIFLKEDESFVIGGVEKGLHGHRGANGARGGPAQFIKVAVKLTVGHGHGPYIRDGVNGVGVQAALDMSYNKGLSSWAQTLEVQYLNGKRTLVTVINGKWRA